MSAYCRSTVYDAHPTKVFFQFEIIINVLAIYVSFEYPFYGSAEIINILFLTMRGSTLDVRTLARPNPVWNGPGQFTGSPWLEFQGKCGDRLWTSESDVYRRQILTSKADPRAVRDNNN